jgi:hypothetical protein
MISIIGITGRVAGILEGLPATIVSVSSESAVSPTQPDQAAICFEIHPASESLALSWPIKRDASWHRVCGEERRTDGL